MSLSRSRSGCTFRSWTQENGHVALGPDPAPLREEGYLPRRLRNPRNNERRGAAYCVAQPADSARRLPTRGGQKFGGGEMSAAATEPIFDELAHHGCIRRHVVAARSPRERARPFAPTYRAQPRSALVVADRLTGRAAQLDLDPAFCHSHARVNAGETRERRARPRRTSRGGLASKLRPVTLTVSSRLSNGNAS